MNEKQRGRRSLKQGRVIASKMQKTIVVGVESVFRHPKYKKVMKSIKKYYAHDEQAHLRKEGELVHIIESRPISKLKRWRILEQTSTSGN